MQYPIIDLITDAYINNGWTGFDVKPINMWNEEWTNGYWDYQDNGNFVSNPNFFSCLEKIPVKENTFYFWYSPPSIREILFYDINGDFMSRIPASNVPGFSFSTPIGCNYITFYYSAAYGTTYNNDISINYPQSFRNYISYEESSNNDTYNKNDIAHRLKLPLPHYFPHPVIDALQRAAAGTQTADDTEILRHYLTPLGIGGI